MKKINWLMLLVFVVVMGLAFLAGVTMFGFSRNGISGLFFMPGRQGGIPGGGGHMGWGFSPPGWLIMGFAMLFMWLIPVGLIALVIYGIVALVRGTGHSSTPLTQRTCPNCGKSTQADWLTCPYCGTALK